MEKIVLEGAINARDLGGMLTKDGRCIRRSKFIRSAALDRLTENDKRILTEDYGLRTVIDLRTNTETAEKPDVSIEGVEHIHIPVYGEETLGISREKKTEASLLENDLPDMADIYRHMIRNPDAVAQYGKIIRRIMASEEGAVLWHCTAGKDRCGMTSVLVEHILGVDMDTIYADYMLTNEVAEPLANSFRDQVLAKTGNARRAEGVRLAFVADRAYLDAAFNEMEKLYGGLDGFVENGLGIDKDSIVAFRRRSLD